MNLILILTVGDFMMLVDWNYKQGEVTIDHDNPNGLISRHANDMRLNNHLLIFE